MSDRGCHFSYQLGRTRSGHWSPSLQQPAHGHRSVRYISTPIRRSPPSLEDTIIVATQTSSTNSTFHTVTTHSTIAESIGNPTPESSKSVSSVSAPRRGSKQPATGPKIRPPGDTIISDLSSVAGALPKPNTDCLSRSIGDCFGINHTLHLTREESLSTWIPEATSKRARPSPSVNTTQSLVVRNIKQGVAATTPSRPTRARRLPYWLGKENHEPLPPASSRPQVDGGNSVSPPDNTSGIWDSQQEPTLQKGKLGFGRPETPLCVLQQIGNSQSQTQAKSGSSVPGSTGVSVQQSVEPPRYEHSSCPRAQQQEAGQPLKTATLNPAEKLDAIQESIKVAPAMPELSSSIVGGDTLPEATSRDTPKKALARRLRKRRNSEITTAISDIAPSPPREPSVETTAVPTRNTRAFAAGTRPAPADGLYSRRYAKKPEVVTESTLPRFSMPTSTFNPDTIVLQYKSQANTGMQLPKSTGNKRQIGCLPSNTGANTEVGPPGPRKRTSRGRPRERNLNSSVEGEHEDDIQAKDKNVNAQPKAGLDRSGSSATVNRLAELSEASLQASPAQEVPSPLPPVHKRDPSVSSEDERQVFAWRAQGRLDLELLPEAFREPYASTFFTPQLDDYDLPSSAQAPPLYYHMELPSHPPVPDRPLLAPVSLTGRADMSVQSTLLTPGELESAVITKLLEPMTDTEGSGDDDATLSNESDGDFPKAPNSIVRFPRDATEETATEYAVLKRALKTGLEQQKEVQGKLAAGLEYQKKMVKAQEDFEKAEHWGERSGPARWAGTRSRSGMTADVPDFLEYLRAKAREGQ